MIARFEPFCLTGAVEAPPSKSMAHRYLMGAALSGERCVLKGVDYSEDILASIDCLKALGAAVTIRGDEVTVEAGNFMKVDEALLPCRESGSTLRFFLPLALCLGKKVLLTGSERLLERPLEVYEQLCRRRGFVFVKERHCVTVQGQLSPDCYTLRGDVSSQFITGLVFALVYLGKEAQIRILPPLESRSYVELTLSALRSFGAKVSFVDPLCLRIEPATLHAYSGNIEGDYSNAAFWEAFRRLGSKLTIGNLNPESLQGDRVYRSYFDAIQGGSPTLDLRDCPDLAPVLFAMAALHGGALFTGTERLKAKESDRGAAMAQELEKLGGSMAIGTDQIRVFPAKLKDSGAVLDGHNDHRIVMALSVILSQTGGVLQGAEAVKKSYPAFFAELQRLGAKVELAQA